MSRLLCRIALALLMLSMVRAEVRPAVNGQAIADTVNAEIAAGNLPGAVVLIGDAEKVLYRQAFGRRAVLPATEATTEETIYDLASLTKVLVTTSAVMQLVEQGKLQLDAPAARYWPALAGNGKSQITIRQLLAHSSGLRADVDLSKLWEGKATAQALLLAEAPRTPPGRVLYSDINFAILGEVVERVSGEALDAYAQRHILAPLQMADSGFRPAAAKQPRIAPTVLTPPGWLRGMVHDPTARRMGGVAGHAGLFGSADDLSRFARMLLSNGRLDGAQILSPDSIAALFTPQSAVDAKHWRGIGWKLEAPLVANRDDLPALGMIAHTGYTGTGLWVDPVSGLYVIILSNRVHPGGRGTAGPIRERILAQLASERPALTASDIAAREPWLLQSAMSRAVLAAPAGERVLSGLDVLAQTQFAALRGLRVGVVTNHTGRDAQGQPTVSVLRAGGVNVAALFSPEHGLAGNVDALVASSREPGGVPIHSLYGATKRPTEAMLAPLDALLFDIQDAGARFYTYSTTMAYAMEAAAKRGIPFFVLDRPNPITAERVGGPVMEAAYKSFTGYFPLPTQHGMTLGELARLFNGENALGADLRVIAMQGYRRSMWYDETGLPWIGPSPNLRTLTATILYPGVALLEAANISVGRGTDTPFEVLGAPWIDGDKLAQALQSRAVAGVHIVPAQFRPSADRDKGELCGGVNITLTDRNRLDAPLLGIELLSAVYALYPERFQIDKTASMLGSGKVLQALRAGEDPQRIVAAWRGDLERFLALRGRYLLY